LFLDDGDVAGVERVGGEVVFGVVAAVEDVSKGRVLGAEDWAGAEVAHLVQGVQAVRRVKPRGDLGWVGLVFDLEQDDVFDGLGSGCHFFFFRL